MLDAAKYAAIERLRSGDRVDIRALRPGDRTELVAAVHRTSARSRYRRFLATKRDFTDKEIAFFVNVDFVNHVAPGSAEVAFAVIDNYQGQGIGSALMRHLIRLARDAGLKELVAEVLPDNVPMLTVFEKSGLRCNSKPDAGVIHVTLRLV
jgi:GNAT superfamily N-acetyltransferase